MAGVRRVEVHDVRDPLDEQRPVGLRPREPVERVEPEGIDARPVAEVGVAIDLGRDEVVGNVVLRGLTIQFAIGDHAVHGEDDRASHVLGRRNLGADFPDHKPVALGLKLLFANAERAKVEAKPQVVPHLGADKRTAAASTDAGGVDMHVEIALRPGRCPRHKA